MKKLKLFFAAFALLLGWSNASANQTLADNGVYYIQNVETGLFLSRGGAYGAHALADNYGLAWRLTGTNGSITLQMYDIYSEGFTSGGLGDNSFVDNGSPLSNWTLEGDENGYTIKTGSTYLTASGNTAGSDVVINGDGTGNKTWILLNDAEHAAVLAAKTSAQESAIATTAGIDLGGSTLSDVLGNTSNWRTSTIAVAAPTSSGIWTYTENRDQGGANNYGDYGTELYNKSGKFTKTISDLENGIYKLTVKSMHRSTHNAPCWTVGESFTNHTNSYVLANGYYAQLKDWKSAAEKNGDDYNPNNTGQFKTKVEAGNYATDIYTYVSDGTLDITVSQEGFWYGEWFAFNGVTLTYYTDQVSDDDATAILNTANGLLDQEMDATIKTNLTNAKNTFDGARTIANYNALQTAITAAQASADAYAAFAPERVKAIALGMDPEVVASYTPDVNALKVAEYNYVTTNYPYAVDLGAWTTVNATERRGQHWDGTTDGKTGSPYSEQANGWGDDSWSCSYSQDIALPAGSYVFKVAGRKSSESAVLTLTVKNGETTLGTVNDFPNGDLGKGIDTSGATNFGEGTFANNGTGRGWQWRYVKFELADPVTVNVAVTASAKAKYQWVGFCNPTVQTDDAANVDLMEALVALNDARTAATLTKYTNVGTGVFQYDETTNNSLWSAYETAKSDAEDYVLTSSSTASEVNTLATALNKAISNYQNQPLNAPDENQAYVLTNTTASGSLKVATESVTVDAGGVVFFTAVEGGYVISNPEGEYIFKTTDNNWTLSTTETKGDAYVVTVKYEGDGAYSIHGAKGYFGTDNTAAGSSVYANKAVSNNGKWTVSLLPSTVSKNITDAGWATYCSPYALDFSTSGLTAYIVTGATGNVLDLETVTSVPANTGVLLEGAAGDYDISVVASADPVVGNKLQGTTANQVVTAETAFVLMGSPKVGFYKNKNEFTVGANTAYLNANFADGGEAREAYFFDGLTGINQVENGEFKSALPVKRIVKGYLVIEKNGVSVNAAGVQVK